jgi:hypothetical protein
MTSQNVEEAFAKLIQSIHLKMKELKTAGLLPKEKEAAALQDQRLQQQRKEGGSWWSCCCCWKRSSSEGRFESTSTIRYPSFLSYNEGGNLNSSLLKNPE